jgi:hypothetical protein
VDAVGTHGQTLNKRAFARLVEEAVAMQKLVKVGEKSESSLRAIQDGLLDAIATQSPVDRSG